MLTLFDFVSVVPTEVLGNNYTTLPLNIALWMFIKGISE